MGNAVVKQEIIDICTDFIRKSEGNYINKKIALSSKVEGIKIFDDPIFGFGDADDKYFLKLKESSVIGEHFVLPKEWLNQARTVISFFLPFSKSIKNSNGQDKLWPSDGWLHGRIEGQVLLNKLCLKLESVLKRRGFMGLSPSLNEKFWSRSGHSNFSRIINSSECISSFFTSNWSERHIAFVCGLGTFGLSKGLITKKGVAGRFGSVVTNLYLKPDLREYGIFSEYCFRCGKCIRQCPVNAITFENGKDHFACSSFLDRIKEKFKPRYGCGKCQINVPCENEIP